VPKVVDHEERRRHIADAVFRVMGRVGMDGAGLREVAEEAGVSMGAVQHYFSSKDEMLLFALDHMRARVIARLSSELVATQGPGNRDYMWAASRAMLPLDQASREEAIVNVAFVAAAMANPSYQDLLRQGYDRLLQVWRDQMRSASDAGRLAKGIDPDAAAPELFFLVQGLIGPVLIGAISTAEAEAILERKLAALFR
jgi:AcrR family transcriptional regulator